MKNFNIIDSISINIKIIFQWENEIIICPILGANTGTSINMVVTIDIIWASFLPSKKSLAIALDITTAAPEPNPCKNLVNKNIT